MPMPLPKELSDILRTERVSNLGLLFNKYIDTWDSQWNVNEKQFLDKIVNANNTRAGEYQDILKALIGRQKLILESLTSYGYHSAHFEKRTDTRLILGLGAAHVLETGMTLHSLYGYPYLPSSGLKGLARAYAEMEGKAPKDELLEIFGSRDKDVRSEDDKRGSLFFLDAIPQKFELDVDIMNPHFSDYYQGKTPPADYLNPKPIFFLTVKAGIPFWFGLYSPNEVFVQKAREWLEGGLQELGSGGKTSSGYGYFGAPSNEMSMGMQSQIPTSQTPPDRMNEFKTWFTNNMKKYENPRNKGQQNEIQQKIEKLPTGFQKEAKEFVKEKLGNHMAENIKKFCDA